MSNQPIVFNLQYTPYRAPKSASAQERARHEHDRAYYAMTAEYTIYDYMTREDKVESNDKNMVPRAPPSPSDQTVSSRFPTFLEYLQKSTKVFNQQGTIPQEELDKMKERARNNRGNIWHGYISFNKEESHKIDSPEKCINFVKSTFGTFFKEARLDEKNIDLRLSLENAEARVDVGLIMAAIRNVINNALKYSYENSIVSFWEKEPKYRSKDGMVEYRRRGKISKAAIDNMFVKAGIWVSDQKEDLYRTRNDATKELRSSLAHAVHRRGTTCIREAIVALAKDLPASGRLAYGSKDMEPFRERVDGIVDLIMQNVPAARAADAKFYTELSRRKQVIKNACNQPYLFSERNNQPETIFRLAKRYHYTIDDSNIHIAEDIEADYRRRMGNAVIGAARDVKPELIVRNVVRERASDGGLKKRIHTSEKRSGKVINSFLKAFQKLVSENSQHARDRLREIEDEIRRERAENDGKNSNREEAYRN